MDLLRDDRNIVAGGLLHDLAILQSSEHSSFGLDSDAHSLAEFPFTDYAIAHARIAQIPADRVVNCWEESRFDGWLEERRGRSSRRNSNTEAQSTQRRTENDLSPRAPTSRGRQRPKTKKIDV